MKYNIITTNQSFYNTGIYSFMLKDYIVVSIKPPAWGQPYFAVHINNILSIEVIK